MKLICSIYNKAILEMDLNSQPVSVEELQTHFDVSLDALNEACCEKHILDLSVYLDDWRLVAPRIGLGQHDIDAVERNGHKEEERRLGALRKWKEKYGYKATYRKLIEALLAISRADLAERVCKSLSSDKVTAVHESSPGGPQFPDQSLPKNDQRRLQLLPVTLGASGDPFTLVSSIIQSVIQISTDLSQESITHQLGHILDQFRSGKVTLGVVGLVNSGKSTTINALLGAKYLPASYQPQTMRTIRIISDHVPFGTLQGKTSSDEFIELARGQKEVHRKVQEFNNRDRDHCCQSLYSELLLTAPIKFLKDSTSDNISVEMFETPGFGEFGCSKALDVSTKALKQMSALLVILDVQMLGEETHRYFIEQIRALHPLIIKRHQRILILLNKCDCCFDGNESLWSTEDLCKTVSELFHNQIPVMQIIPFSAKWALEARQWLMNPHQVSEDDLGAAYYTLRRTPMKDSVTELNCRYSLDNVLKLGKCLEEASNVQKVEERLFEMTCIQRPAILLESIIDDIAREVSALKEAIAKEIKTTDISGRKREVSQQSDLVQKVTDTIDTHCKERLTDQLLADITEDFVVHQNAIVSTLRNSILVDINTLLPQLQGEHVDLNGLKLHVESIRGEIVSTTMRELTRAWPEAMTVMKRRQKTLLGHAMAELKADLVTARISEYVCIENINTDQIVGQCIAAVQELAPPPVADYQAISSENIRSLIVTQTAELGLHKGSTYRANIDELNKVFITLGDYYIKHFKSQLQETLKVSSTAISLQTNVAIKKISNQPLWKLQHELERRMKMLDLSGNRVMALEHNQRQLDDASKALSKLHVVLS